MRAPEPAPVKVHTGGADVRRAVQLEEGEECQDVWHRDGCTVQKDVAIPGHLDKGGHVAADGQVPPTSWPHLRGVTWMSTPLVLEPNSIEPKSPMPD